MLKTNNKYLKISNIIFIVLSCMSLVSIVTALVKGYKDIEGMTAEMYYTDIIILSMYIVLSAIILWITNKKVDLYAEEYPKSRKIFNIFFILSCMSVALMIVTGIISIVLKKDNSVYSLLCVILGYIPTYSYAYYVVSKGSILSKDNSKRTNIFNFIAIILLINYASNIITLLLQIIFNINDIVLVVKEILLSFIFAFFILIAYKIINMKSTK